MAGFIERDQWNSFLTEFSKRNQLRPTRLEEVGSLGDQEEETYLPLLGVSLETKGSRAGSIVVLLGGETAKEERHADHVVEDVQRITPLVGIKGFEDGLGFETRDGKTLLLFEQLPELPAD
jgi:sulfur carrier protein ThiS